MQRAKGEHRVDGQAAIQEALTLTTQKFNKFYNIQLKFQKHIDSVNQKAKQNILRYYTKGGMEYNLNNFDNDENNQQQIEQDTMMNIKNFLEMCNFVQKDTKQLQDQQQKQCYFNEVYAFRNAVGSVNQNAYQFHIQKPTADCRDSNISLEIIDAIDPKQLGQTIIMEENQIPNMKILEIQLVFPDLQMYVENSDESIYFIQDFMKKFSQIVIYVDKNRRFIYKTQISLFQGENYIKKLIKHLDSLYLVALHFYHLQSYIHYGDNGIPKDMQQVQNYIVNMKSQINFDYEDYVINSEMIYDFYEEDIEYFIEQEKKRKEQEDIQKKLQIQLQQQQQQLYLQQQQKQQQYQQQQHNNNYNINSEPSSSSFSYIQGQYQNKIQNNQQNISVPQNTFAGQNCFENGSMQQEQYAQPFNSNYQSSFSTDCSSFGFQNTSFSSNYQSNIQNSQNMSLFSSNSGIGNQFSSQGQQYQQQQQQQKQQQQKQQQYKQYEYQRSSSQQKYKQNNQQQQYFKQQQKTPVQQDFNYKQQIYQKQYQQQQQQPEQVKILKKIGQQQLNQKYQNDHDVSQQFSQLSMLQSDTQ